MNSSLPVSAKGRNVANSAIDRAAVGPLTSGDAAAIRVDMRGSGDSDGLMHDEYAKQEQDDALEVIAWIAAQPWCSGRVGMMGISWGGFNALQVAALRPPALAAIVTICSTDDRYDSVFLANYAQINLLNQVASLDGVGECRADAAPRRS